MITPICAFIGAFAASWAYHRYANPKRIYCNDDGWMPIEMIPEESTELSIFLTDGEKVCEEYCRLRDYNKKGQVIFGFDKKVATHWRRLPLPPTRKLSE